MQRKNIFLNIIDALFYTKVTSKDGRILRIPKKESYEIMVGVQFCLITLLNKGKQALPHKAATVKGKITNK